MTLTLLRKLLGRELRKAGPYTVQQDEERITVEKYEWECGCYVREPISHTYEGFRSHFCEAHKARLEEALLGEMR